MTAEDELRKNGMMAHLLDALEQGEGIGHYGRLVFAMVARHFMDEKELAFSGTGSSSGSSLGSCPTHGEP